MNVFVHVRSDMTPVNLEVKFCLLYSVVLYTSVDLFVSVDIHISALICLQLHEVFNSYLFYTESLNHQQMYSKRYKYNHMKSYFA